ncbi:PREDICTED: probable calcium-binding protein CML44 [Tarenaya hassleriana]|uniref:probable calcium-binding protein CML44 n=1 Tax=Tarenaya hassleriana TaxID=28532 RepID=UPI00053C94F2|nr:PREDICTED: probable calcium-binding protein CML44 [Tarenaya hassleriana]
MALNRSYLRIIFEKLDKNRDGLVTIDELQWLLERLGFVEQTAEELQLIVGKQSLDLDEFSLFYDAVSKDGDDDIVRAFDVFDLNGDGYISSEELRIVLDRLGLWDESKADDCGRMTRVHDRNLDGLIDFEEFKNMILHVQ